MAVHGKAQQGLVEGVDLLGEVGVLGRKACGNPEILTFLGHLTVGSHLEDSWMTLGQCWPICHLHPIAIFGSVLPSLLLPRVIAIRGEKTTQS